MHSFLLVNTNTFIVHFIHAMRMEDGKERHWQSADMSVSKVVIVEGDCLQKCGTFGASIQLKVDEIEHLAFESVFFNNDTIEKKQIVDVRIGRAFNDFDLGIEQAVASMYPGEKSRFDVMGPDWQSLNFVMTRLDDSTSSSSISDWTNDERMQFAQECYDQGVELIRRQNYKGAFKMFRQASLLTTFNEQESAVDLRLKSLSNMTLCQKNMNNCDHAVTGINVLLEKFANAPNRTKLLARAGHCQIRQQNYEAAIVNLEEALSKDSTNKQILADLKEAKAKLKSHEIKLGNAMKKMFSS